ncbi:hypothetical protein HKD21_11485 [Gluconobacter cerevisiae]|uniref:Uncharacterized protein n=2 Tax=Gluconobacter TaxID=441 RepID=A0ABR9YFM3_9PROT|nr:MULTISPECIES: hypothetical protein [Gluconobacter]MBF0877465.1 hypothetical protein [Gluconobacter cerevisiae]GBR32393.1 hypothetical protein AA3266_1065 [Gluconobacter kondonii NBRC 3266]GLQ65226.1 hypothetical protein GCM10007870_08100 [Gluconobacter kondonii]
MDTVSNEVIFGALKKVLPPESDDSWVLRPDFEGVASKDLKDFINEGIRCAQYETHHIKTWLRTAIEDLIDQRFKEKSVGLDPYEQYVMKRDAKSSLSDIPRLVDRVYNFLFLSGH